MRIQDNNTHHVDKLPEVQVRSAVESTGGATEIGDYFDVTIIQPGSELWTQMGRLRKKSYIDDNKYLPESRVDDNGLELDEYDEYNSTIHFGAIDELGGLIGTVRVVCRNSGVNNGLILPEMAYQREFQEDAGELGRFIVDKEHLGSDNSAVVSLSLLRAVMHHTRDISSDFKLYAMLDRHLINYFGRMVGITLSEIGGERQINECDTVDSLIEINPHLATSQIASYETTTDRSIGIIDRVAPFFEDMKIKKGLGRVSLREATISSEKCDRNLGWISQAEQDHLRDSKVSIAGVGGDGGSLAVELARSGVGEFVLADPERFEVENLNRQEGSDYTSIGRNKAEVIAEEIKKINPYAKVTVYTDGVTEGNVKEFMSNSGLVIDETEYTYQNLAVMIGREARSNNIPVLTALNIGFGGYVTSYDPGGKSIEDQLGVSRAMPLDEVAGLKVDISNWVAHIPSYSDMSIFKDVADGKRSTPTVGAGVQLAAGVAVTQALAHLLSPITPERKKWITYYPKGVSIDAIDGMRIIRNGKVHFYMSAGRAVLRTLLGRNPKTG